MLAEARRLPGRGTFLALDAPAPILPFLVRVAGTPATERQAVRTKGDACRACRRRTRAFVPWFPRRDGE